MVYLVQTDTTVGFLSKDDKELASIKNRSHTQKTLRVVDKFKTLKTHTRIPKHFRKQIRNSKNTTFIYPNKESFRVVDKNSLHYNFIKKFGILYSTSANLSGEKFDLNFAQKNSDVEVITNRDYFENISSNIMKITNKALCKIR